jgi:beta-galactosidase
MRDDLKTALSDSEAEVLIGPRSAARDGDFTIPVPLPPAWPGLDVTVTRLETIRPDMPIAVDGGGHIKNWFEHLEGQSEIAFTIESGMPVALRSGRTTYCGGWGDDAFFDRLVKDLCDRAGVDTIALPMGVRLRDTGAERFWFNHNPHDVEIAGKILRPAGVIRELKA